MSPPACPLVSFQSIRRIESKVEPNLIVVCGNCFWYRSRRTEARRPSCHTQKSSTLRAASLDSNGVYIVSLFFFFIILIPQV
jgi:hypothetical protein